MTNASKEHGDIVAQSKGRRLSWQPWLFPGSYLLFILLFAVISVTVICNRTQTKLLFSRSARCWFAVNSRLCKNKKGTRKQGHNHRPVLHGSTVKTEITLKKKYKNTADSHRGVRVHPQLNVNYKESRNVQMVANLAPCTHLLYTRRWRRYKLLPKV